MVINRLKQAGLQFTKANEGQIIQDRVNSLMSMPVSEEIKLDCKMRIEETVNSEGTSLYILTKTVIDLSSRIKFDGDKFDFKYLDSLKDKKVTFLLGDKFYRWFKSPGKINVVAVSKVEITNDMKKYYPANVTHDMSYVFFSIDTKHGSVSFPPNPSKPFSETETVADFVRLLVFTELSPIETRTLNPNQSTGTRREGKYLNSSDKRIVIVDSMWNTNIVITKGFLVSGHFRMQRCGKNWSERELIWISGFDKIGYTRGAKKLDN